MSTTVRPSVSGAGASTVWSSPTPPDDDPGPTGPATSTPSPSHRSLTRHHQEGSPTMTTSNPVNATAAGAVNAAASGSVSAIGRHAASRQAPSGRTSRIEGKQTFLRAVAAEWIKVWSLRSTWITSVITVGVTVLLGAGIAIGYAGSAEMADDAANMLPAGTTFGQIVVAVLGALVITGEYSSGQIRSSLAAVPGRTRLLTAKSLVVAVTGFILGTVSMLLAWAVSAPFMHGHAGSLTDAHYLGFFWGSGLGFAVIALMAFGLGVMMRSTAGSITVVTVLLFVINIPLSIMSNKWDWATTLMGLLPANTVSALTDPFQLTVTWGNTGSVTFLQHWQAVLVTCAWAVVPLTIGWLVFSRRDA